MAYSVHGCDLKKNQRTENLGKRAKKNPKELFFFFRKSAIFNVKTQFSTIRKKSKFKQIVCRRNKKHRARYY